MEMLSEHTLEGWFEGYVLTGRHGLFATYEAFVHIIDSMFNQHAKWLEKAKTRSRLARADFLDQHADHVARVAAGSQRLHASGPGLPRRRDEQESRGHADLLAARCQLPVERGRSLPARADYVNVIVADKQPHLQYLDMEAAVKHCTQGHRHLGLGEQR